MRYRSSVSPVRWVGAVAALLAVAAPGLTAQGLLVSGYADFEATWMNPFGSGNSDLYGDNHHFNLVMVGDIVDDVFVSGEVEYEHSGDEISLEYGYVGYTGFKNVRIMAGKFIVPFGRFQKDLHPTWINKMIDRPHGFKNILPQTYSDAGVWVSGAAPVEGGRRVTYDVFVVNGLMGPDGGDIRGFRDNIDETLPGGGRNDNKAFGGRLGFEAAPEGFDIGGSFYYGGYSDDPALDLNLLMLGADAAYRRNGWELRAEVVHANQDATGGDLKKTGGYAQIAWMATPKWEPVVRFSARSMPGTNQDQARVSFGLNFHVGPAAVFRINYHANIERTAFSSNNDTIKTQFAVVF